MITVQLFAGARELAGQPELVVELPADATYDDLAHAVGRSVPALAPMIAHSRFAANACYVRGTDSVDAKAEIAMIPPVSGG